MLTGRRVPLIAFILLASAAPAVAQEPTNVVLLAPAEVRAEWTAALQIELASRGARVVPLDPPEAETVLLRDAEAQRLAREHGARAAARVEDGEAGLTLRVIGRDAPSARVVPIAREADPRTVALILVSILDEPHPPSAGFVPPPPPPPPPVEGAAVPPPPAPPSTALSPASAATDPEVASAAAPAEPRAVQWSGRVGTGSFALVNDRRFIPGAMLRGGLGLRVGRFETAFLVDVGIMFDQLENAGTELQPIGRLCLESGAAIPFGAWAFHVGGRGCGGVAELRKLEFFDPFSPPFPVDQVGALFAAGGYLGLSVGLSSSIRLYIRIDVEGTMLESSMHFGEVMPALTIVLTFS